MGFGVYARQAMFIAPSVLEDTKDLLNPYAKALFFFFLPFAIKWACYLGIPPALRAGPRYPLLPSVPLLSLADTRSGLRPPRHYLA